MKKELEKMGALHSQANLKAIEAASNNEDRMEKPTCRICETDQIYRGNICYDCWQQRSS